MFEGENMYRTKIKLAVQSVLLATLLSFAVTPALAFDNANGPELPEQCSSIRVGEGNKLAFHVYARGVQVYRWNANTLTWDFIAPVASLFAEENYFGEVGSHYVGPTWESKSGSKVEARRVQGTGCAPDPTAIPWILLSKHRTEGSGIFSAVTFIQRVNTTGGMVPSTPGTTHGEQKEVPYTAEYYFYRADKPFKE
jgi:uncharacterized protein DUF3455